MLMLAAAFFTGIMSISCVRDRRNGSEGLAVGDKLPEFQAVMNDGSTVCVPDDLKGGVSCIVFFNTGCADCRQELPVIQQLYDDVEGVFFLLVSRAEDEASISSWWAANGITMPFSPQPDRLIYSLFAPSVIPRIYVSDSNARIVRTFSDKDMPSYGELKQILMDYSAGTKASPGFVLHR